VSPASGIATQPIGLSLALASDTTADLGGNLSFVPPIADNGALVMRGGSVVVNGLWLGLLLLLLVGSAGAASNDRDGGASSRAYAIKVLIPGQGGAATPTVAAPTDAVVFGGPLAYPDAAGVTIAASTASASAHAGQVPVATASSEVTGFSMFGGEITAASIKARAHARANAKGASGDFEESSVDGLVALGQSVTSGTVPLGDWGTLTLMAQGVAPAARSYRGNVTVLTINLTADHGGLPAGTQVLVGYAEAAVESPTPSETPVTDVGKKGNVLGQSKNAKRKKGGPQLTPPEPDNLLPRVRGAPLGVTPKLTAGGYVFPVYGSSSFTNDWGAPRASTGWHHGTDIFAPLGAPLLAVARGTIFSVGWNDVGGYRLWLRDRQGNQFYYAHLSAFTPLAVNGAHVRAGDVIGFVGNSGDAEGTPYHLHFEIHPVGYLSLGYDGAVNPYRYLLAWKRVEDLRFSGASGWAPPVAISANAPKPGAILLQITDISTANGLRPGSIARAFVAPVSAEGDGRLVGATRPAGRGARR
jgi:murein DD-endopeptidase MepM/ murein hydrolase activator NlpD